MKTVKQMFMTVLGLLVIGIPSVLQAATLFSADFQSDTPGTPPSVVGNVLDNGTTRIVTTTDAASDPFGVPGNQSMKLVDRDGTGNGYRASIALGTLPATNSDVTIEMDMVYGVPVGAWTVTNIFIGDSVGAALPWFPNATTAQIFPALTTGGTASVGQPGGYYSQGAVGGGGVVIAQDVPFRLKVVSDAATSTYKVFVNGIPLGWDFGSGTIFDIETGTDQVNMMTFTSEGLGVPSMGDVFVDNILVTVIPEPTSLTLLSAVLCGLTLLGRRSRIA